MVKRTTDLSKFLIVYFFLSSITFCQLHIENIDEYLKKPVIVELTTGEKLNGQFILKRDNDCLFQTKSGQRIFIKTSELKNIQLNKSERLRRIVVTGATLSLSCLVLIVLAYYGIFLV